MRSTSRRRMSCRVLVSGFIAVVAASCSGGTTSRRVVATSRLDPAPVVVAGDGSAVDPIPLSGATCLARSSTRINTINGAVPTSTRLDAPLDGTTLDLRAATYTGDGTISATTGEANIYPVLLGKARPTSGMCVIGGSVPGTMNPAMTWPQMKAEKPQTDGRSVYFDAAALTEYARGDAPHLVDGFRVNNVGDAVAARGSFATTRTLPVDGGNFFVRNAYFTNVHDDCVDLNDFISGVVFDSLLDGCYTGFSQRPDRQSPLRHEVAPKGDQFVLDHVLVRMAGFPGPHPTHQCPAGTRSGYNQIFKWSPGANQLVVRHAVFLLDRAPCSDRFFPFPPNSRLQDVTIVWTGSGGWRWPRPPGVRVTGDRSAWNKARLTWLQRHGCPDTSATVAATSNPCSRLTDPLLR